MEQSKGHGLRSVLNVVALVMMLVINALANALPLNGMNTGELSDLIPNLFVPAGITFAIWGPIYLLLILFVITLVAKGRTEDPAGRIGWWFVLSCVANSLWIITWHWRLVGLSLVVMLILLATLVIMYRKTRIDDAPLAQRIGIMLPLSVYLGWITVATIANATSLLVVVGWDRFGRPELFWTLVVMVVAILINLLAIILEGDIWFALVGAWALYGIYLKRSALASADSSPIVLTALIGMIAIGVAVVIHLVVKGRRIAAESDRI